MYTYRTVGFKNSFRTIVMVVGVISSAICAGNWVKLYMNFLESNFGDGYNHAIIDYTWKKSLGINRVEFCF